MSQFNRGGDSRPESDSPVELTLPSGSDSESLQVERSEAELLPAEAFALLGNETRIAILQALLEASTERGPVAFTELFDRVDIDDSAQFNYHLQKLTDHFVQHTDNGYKFRHPGRKVVSAIFAGTLTDRAQLGFFPASGTCHACDGPLHGWYVDEVLTIACIDCATIQVSYPFPPGGLDDRTPRELLQAFHHYVRHHYCLAADGVCPECTGPIETTLVSDPATSNNGVSLDVAVEHDCQRCGYDLQSTVGVNLLDSGEVLVFHSERGVDLTTEPFWHFDWCVSDARTTVLSEEPLRVRVDIPCQGDEFQVVLDDTLSIVETTVIERRTH